MSDEFERDVPKPDERDEISHTRQRKPWRAPQVISSQFEATAAMGVQKKDVGTNTRVVS